MSVEHRRRIKARLIYRRWALLRQLRWFPPYGWITKARALGLSYHTWPINAAGMDRGSPEGDISTISWREGDHLVIHELPAINHELFAQIEDMMRARQEMFDNLFYHIATGKKQP